MGGCTKKWCRQLWSLPCLVMRNGFNTGAAQVHHPWPLGAQLVPCSERWAIKFCIFYREPKREMVLMSKLFCVGVAAPCCVLFLWPSPACSRRLQLLLVLVGSGVPISSTTPLHNLNGWGGMRSMGSGAPRASSSALGVPLPVTWRGEAWMALCFPSCSNCDGGKFLAE